MIALATSSVSGFPLDRRIRSRPTILRSAPDRSCPAVYVSARLVSDK